MFGSTRSLADPCGVVADESTKSLLAGPPENVMFHERNVSATVADPPVVVKVPAAVRPSVNLAFSVQVVLADATPVHASSIAEAIKPLHQEIRLDRPINSSTFFGSVIAMQCWLASLRIQSPERADILPNISG